MFRSREKRSEGMFFEFCVLQSYTNIVVLLIVIDYIIAIEEFKFSYQEFQEFKLRNDVRWSQEVFVYHCVYYCIYLVVN